MKFVRSPELKLLQLVCTQALTTERKSLVIQLLRQEQIDLKRLLTLATRHRLTPFLYQAFRHLPEGQVPESFLETLHNRYRTDAIDVLVKQHQYQQVAAVLTANGIDHFAYKGVYLAQDIYPAGYLRISGDIDLLVNDIDVARTIALFQADKYRLMSKHTYYYQDGEKRMLTDLSEVSLFTSRFNHPLDLDLHWKILCFNKDYASFDLSFIRRQPEYGIEIQVFLLVIHHGVTSIWQQIYYVNDLYFLLNHPINWNWLMGELRRYGLEQIFLVGLVFCDQLWMLNLPPAIKELTQVSSVQQLAKRYQRAWEWEAPAAFSPLVFRQLLFFFQAQTSLRNRGKLLYSFFSSRVFRASIFQIGKSVIYISREWGFLTIFLRALRSILNFLPNYRLLVDSVKQRV